MTQSGHSVWAKGRLIVGVAEESLMDSVRLNRWLTLGANLGVLIGIILLLVELDQNRDMMRAQTRHQLAMGLVELQIATGTNQQLVELLDRADSGEELTNAEQRQVGYRFNALIRYWENVHYQYRQDLYDEMEFAAQKEAWRKSFEDSPAITSYWCRMRLMYSPEFMAELDSLLPTNTC